MAASDGLPPTLMIPLREIADARQFQARTAMKQVTAIGAGVMAALLLSLGAGTRAMQGGPARPRAENIPQFQYDATWPKALPGNWVLGQVAGVAVDAKDHIWIIHRPWSLTDDEKFATSDPPGASCCAPAPAVVEFDQAGNFVQAWGGPDKDKRYEWPEREHGILIDHKDRVWIADAGPKGAHILAFTRDGKFLLQKGRAGQSTGSNDTENFGQPSKFALDAKANELYVADGYKNRRVVVVDADTGAYKRHWGAYGGKPDDAALPPFEPGAPLPKQFRAPVHSIALSNDGLVYVGDLGNLRIQVFRKDGTFVKEASVAPGTRGLSSTPRAHGTVHGLGFSTDAQQRFLYVLDASNKKLWILRRDDLQTLGGFGRGGHFAGQFTVPHAMAVDSKGNIYVGESLEGKRVQRFKYMGMGSSSSN
jgi:hypothetical protein